MFRGEVPQAHGLGGADACGLYDGVLAVNGVDVLRVVAARHVLYPGVRDVRAGDRVLPAGLLLVVRQVPQVAARWLHPPGDPPQPFGPVPGAGHQARDLRDVLVVFGPAVLPGAGLPRACGDLPDRVAGQFGHPDRDAARLMITVHEPPGAPGVAAGPGQRTEPVVMPQEPLHDMAVTAVIRRHGPGIAGYHPVRSGDGQGAAAARADVGDEGENLDAGQRHGI